MPPNFMWKDPKLGTETKAVFRQAVLKCDHFSEAFSYSFSIFFVCTCICTCMYICKFTCVEAHTCECTVYMHVEA